MPLHDDTASASVTLPDGRVVTNLADDAYAATYSDPGTTGGHEIDPDVLAAAVAEAQGAP